MKHLVILVLSLFLLSCNKENSSKINSSCPNKVIVDDAEYAGIKDQSLSIRSASIENNCLKVKIQSGGCSGSTWKLRLIGTTSIIKTAPAKRLLKFDLENTELCLALPDRDFSFDLTPYQMDDSEKLVIIIDGFEEELTYKY